MPSKVLSVAISGLDAKIVEVEADVSYGLRCFNIVGLPDKAVEESKERIGAAIKSSKLSSPHQQPLRVLINLAPADLKKEGSLYDLPIALSYLLASKQIKFKNEEKIFIGELALDGKLRPVKGALSFAILAKRIGIKEIILPKENAKEASLIKDLRIVGLKNLTEVINYLEEKMEVPPLENTADDFSRVPDYQIDLSWIKGQEYAKRALEIAAAGAHHFLMSGPPGGGKTLLAKTIPSLLPPLNFDESLEVTKIYSIAGLLSEENPFINFPPFRSPHHTASEAALIGGGNPLRPGEITLSHRGVLFLDEFPEFHRDVLESLRQPLEEGKIMVSRLKNSFTFPARFMLVGATNPCPCGYLNDPEKPCTCTPSQISMYRRKLSGPLMDRFDIFIDVPAVKYEKLASDAAEDSSAKIREKITAARELQRKRFNEDKISANRAHSDLCASVNSEMTIKEIKKYCKHDLKSQDLLRKYVDSRKLSARGYHRILKVARTIADLESAENISYDHIAEALMYRLRDRV